jgi:hypothetical protein
VTLSAPQRDFCLAVAEEAGILEPVGVASEESPNGGTWPQVRCKRYAFLQATVVDPPTLDELIALLWSFPGVRAGFIKGRMADLWLFVAEQECSGPVADFVRSHALYDVELVLEPLATEQSAVDCATKAVAWMQARGADAQRCDQIGERLRARLRMPRRTPLPPVAPVTVDIQWSSDDAFAGVLHVDNVPHALRFSQEWGAAAMALAV